MDAFKSLAGDASPELTALVLDIEEMPKKCRNTGEKCAKTCSKEMIMACYATIGATEWRTAVTLRDIFDTFDSIGARPYMLVAGNTAHGVYRRPHDIEVFIDVNGVAELRGHVSTPDRLEVGGGVTLTDFMEILAKAAAANQQFFGYCTELVRHIDVVATIPVRNVIIWNFITNDPCFAKPSTINISPFILDGHDRGQSLDKASA